MFSFLNPVILFALPALVLPIAIYFLVNRKKIVLNFAAYEWMKRAVKKHRKKKKIDDLLKIIAKTLLVLALLLFMSRPVMHSSSRNLLIVVDTSPSMSAANGEETLLDEARRVARELVSEYPNANCSIATFDGKLKLLGTGLSTRGVQAALDSLTPGAGADSLRALILGLTDDAEYRDFDTICFVTDLQKSNYPEKAQITELLRKMNGRKLIFVPVTRPTELRNISLDTLIPPREGFFPGRNNLVYAVVTNHSEKEEDVSVTLLVDDVRKDMGHVRLPPGKSEDVPLRLNLPADKESVVTVEIPSDDMKLDNTLRIVAKPKARTNILGIVRPKQQGEFSEDVFVRNAISSFSDSGELFRYTTVSPAQAAVVPYENYDLVISFGVPLDAKTEVSDALNEYLKNGGSLISFAPASAPENFWRAIGIDSTFVRLGAPAIPDSERNMDSYLYFLRGMRMNPDLFQFKTASGIRLDTVTPDVKNRTYLRTLPEPILLSLKKGDGKVVLAGFLPTKEEIGCVYNPNFVQFVMLLIADALPQESFRTLTGRDVLNIPLSDLRFTPGDAVTLTGSDGAVLDATVGLNDSGGRCLELKDMVSAPMLVSLEHNGEKIMSAGLNPTREDSNLTAFDTTDFEEALAAGFMEYRKSGVPTDGSTKRGNFTLLFLLLTAALLFDAYAHFGRRRP